MSDTLPQTKALWAAHEAILGARASDPALADEVVLLLLDAETKVLEAIKAVLEQVPTDKEPVDGDA